jgi:hypothetical protein
MGDHAPTIATFNPERTTLLAPVSGRIPWTRLVTVLVVPFDINPRGRKESL